MRRNCPEWFQEKLSRVGGLNRYGEPNFKLVWSESETMRDGGYFLKDGYEGYRDVPAYGGGKCWALIKWEPPEMFGTVSEWRRTKRDEVTGLMTLGDFPFRGRYRLIQKLQYREFIGGELYTTNMEPSHFILEILVPLIIQWNRYSYVKRLSIIQEEMEREEKENDQRMEDAMHACTIRRDSPMVQKRAELMERNMATAIAIAARTQPGMMQKGA